jgi:hypothetical protein
VSELFVCIPDLVLVEKRNIETSAWPFRDLLNKMCTVKPRCIVFEGDGKQKRIWENDIFGKPLKSTDKKNLMTSIYWQLQDTTLH